MTHPKGLGDPVGEDPLSLLFAGPTDEDRARLRADLLARAAQVRASSWEQYRGIWSTGQVIGVAAVLEEHAELAALGETEQSALERWAFDLWGLDGGQADADNDCAATREWFRDAASEFDNGYLQLVIDFDGLRTDDEAGEGSDLESCGVVCLDAESPTDSPFRTHRVGGANREGGGK